MTATKRLLVTVAKYIECKAWHNKNKLHYSSALVSYMLHFIFKPCNMIYTGTRDDIFSNGTVLVLDSAKLLIFPFTFYGKQYRSFDNLVY